MRTVVRTKTSNGIDYLYEITCYVKATARQT
ncbi:MAG: hypothetical protein BWX50_00170 [Euryarchaeota archaeon ADurb.Bin009]|nr:MAG: hypothetical protein BWX50_00170 [Euryarchaeota archaeon ADurb.Bin009]